jgi:hypothetical protein
MKNNRRYLVEFHSLQSELIDAGFDVCLAIVALDLPLHIIVHQAEHAKRCESLKDFGVANIFQKAVLSDVDYQHLKDEAVFCLVF